MLAPASMRRLAPALLATAACAWAIVSCRTIKNPAYCDAQNPCPSGQVCDESTNACVTASPDFAGLDLLGVDLTRCASSASCTDPTQPICDNGSCRGCTAPAECAAANPSRPFCGAMGRCVQCLDATQCKNPTPTCDMSDFTCRACAAHSDCTATRLCLPDGTCAGAVIYVDAKAPCPGAGTLGGPYCALSDGVNAAATGAGLLHVAASTTAYSPFALAAGTVAAYADPPFVIGQMPTAQITGSGMTPNVTVTGGQLTLDGFEVQSSGAAAVSCASASVTVRRSWIHDNVGSGVAAASCTVTLRGDLIGPSNLLDGIHLADGTYAVEDCMFANNPRLAISLLGAATGVLRWNSIAGNGSSPTPGAISCGVGAPGLVEHSIVWGNGSDGTGMYWIGPCTFADNDLQSAMGGNDSLPPAFKSVGSGDLHLVPGAMNDACCVDKTDPGAVTGPPAPPLDFDNTARLKGPKYDRGAQELK